MIQRSLRDDASVAEPPSVGLDTAWGSVTGLKGSSFSDFAVLVSNRSMAVGEHLEPFGLLAISVKVLACYDAACQHTFANE